MFTQREMDTALVEAKAEVQLMLQEWMVDYLGSRLDGDNRGRGQQAEGAEAQAAQSAGVATQGGQAY